MCKIYHMSAIDFILECGHKIVERVVAVKGWEMPDNFTIRQRSGGAF